MRRGLCDNSNFKIVDLVADNDVINEGLLKRQKLFNKLSAEKQYVLSDANKNKTVTTNCWFK